MQIIFAYILRRLTVSLHHQFSDVEQIRAKLLARRHEARGGEPRDDLRRGEDEHSQLSGAYEDGESSWYPATGLEWIAGEALTKDEVADLVQALDAQRIRSVRQLERLQEKHLEKIDLGLGESAVLFDLWRYVHKDFVRPAPVAWSFAPLSGAEPVRSPKLLVRNDSTEIDRAGFGRCSSFVG